MSGGAPIVKVDGLSVEFVGGDKPVRAVAGVDLMLRPGEGWRCSANRAQARA